MIKKMSSLGALLLVAGAVASVGCGAADMEGEAFGEGDSEIATFEAEIGEASCGLMSCTPANSCTALNIRTCQTSFALSTPNYGGGANCPRQYVAEDTTPPTTGTRILPMFNWRGAPLNAANCATAKVESALYKKIGTASPTLVGTETHRGVWHGTFCTLTSFTSKPFIIPSAGLTGVRATASATLGANLQAVEVGFWHQC
jgi:hypothetical protein